ncbi:MAG: hypothetical protein WC909_02360 [Candidatus Paceibacterota bacterium]|jgi:hypothetical protein
MDIRKILEGSNNIGILTKKNANNDAIGASLALFFTLQSIGKKACFPSKRIPGELLDFLKKKGGKKFQVTFDDEISEVYYEKKGKGIVLYLEPKDRNAKDEKFSCKIISGENFVSSDYDILFTLGVEDFKEVENLLGEDEQLSNCTIINIDKSLNNQNYGEVNIIKESQSLSQTVACLLKELGEYNNRDALNFLLYGLAFSGKKTDNIKKVSTVKWILKNGGDLSLFSGSFEDNKLLEIVLKNITLEEDVYFSFVSRGDFLESNTNSKNLGFTVEKLKNFLNIPSFFVLWEDKNIIKGLLYSDKKYLIEKTHIFFKGSFKEKGGIFLTGETTINKAKNKLLSYLK